ncbi:MAG: sulfatase family protein [Anaerolineae bacterium]
MSSNHRARNILLFLPDQHRPDWLGLNPDLPVRTPNLDRLAREGTCFTRALCPSPLCAPSRASLAAGRDYPHCGVANNDQDYPLDQPTFYGQLREGGYHVLGVGKFDLHKASKDHNLQGTAYLSAWGFSDGVDNMGKWDAVNSWDGAPHDAYMAYLDRHGLAEVHVADMEARRGKSYAATDPTPLPEHAYCDNWIADNGLRLLSEAPSDQPWFMQVNFTGPHDPMDITTRMRERWEDVDFPPPCDSSQFDEATHSRIRQNYTAMVENIDRHVGRYLEAIEARGEIDSTLIIYSSDHGEMLGDHDLWAKSTYYQPSVGVPLIIAGPDVATGRTFDGPVTLHDLAATCIDYAGLPSLEATDSRSLRPVLTGQSGEYRPYVVSGLVTPRRAWHLIYDGRYKLVIVQGEPPILFDLDEDPWENRNIAREAPSTVARLQATLERELRGLGPADCGVTGCGTCSGCSC